MEKEFEPAMKLNLQFFADGVHDETPETVDPEIADTEETNDTELDEAENTEEEDDPEALDDSDEQSEGHVQTPEENAIYANMRRRAEAEAQRKFEAQQRAIDAQYAQMFAGYTNPITGEPIRSANDYIAAMAAQERQNAENQMAAAGIDKNLLNNLIENNPTVIEAREAIRRANDAQAESMIHEDYRKILEIDPTIGNEADVPASEGFAEAIQYTVDHPGIRLSDAYKIVNFDRLSSSKTQAARQAAISKAKSKEHLSVASGINAPSDGEDIPSGVLSMWKEAFPEKTPAQLKALYNKSIKANIGRKR